MKRQASVLAIRLETPSYWAVWVVRESVRKALKNKMKFDSREELIESTKKIGNIKFKFSIDSILKKSKLLQKIKTQKNLLNWM